MAYYKPLDGLRGVQIDFNKFQFSWNTGNDYQAHFLWIFKEDELNTPQMWKYGQCIENRIQVSFQYNNVPLQEIRKVRFLIFLSDEQRAPSQNDIYIMSQNPKFLCEVCCGTGEIQWRWVADKPGMGLIINSDKKVPEGILYYDYVYGNKQFYFEIPGEISCGDNFYRNIFFPELPAAPQLKSREPNLRVCQATGKNAVKSRGGTDNGGFLKKIADMIRH